jgi:hypothetical protein
MGLFPLADTNNWLSSVSSRVRPALVRRRVTRANVVWWWLTASPTVCPTAASSDPSDDSSLIHHQARRPRTGSDTRQASSARCIRRAAVPRSPHRAVAALAERGPPPAASRFT